MKTLILILFTLVSCQNPSSDSSKSTDSEPQAKTLEVPEENEFEIAQENSITDGEYFSECVSGEKSKLVIDQFQIKVYSSIYATDTCDNDTENETVIVNINRDNLAHIQTRFIANDSALYPCGIDSLPNEQVGVNNMNCHVSWENVLIELEGNSEIGYILNGTIYN